MTDEFPRPTPGIPPDQRPASDVPPWWADLERRDLPDDSGRVAARPAVRRSSPRPAPEVAAPSTAPVAQRRPQPVIPPTEREPGDRLRTMLTTTLVVLVAGLIAWIGIGGGSARSLVVVVLLFGVPTALAALAATVVLRRGGS